MICRWVLFQLAHKTMLYLVYLCSLLVCCLEMANGIKLYSTFTSVVIRHLAILLLHPDDYTVLLYITQHSPTQTGTTAMATPLECGNTGYSFIHQVILHLRLYTLRQLKVQPIDAFVQTHKINTPLYIRKCHEV